jgi:hypothetical protein
MYEVIVKERECREGIRMREEEATKDKSGRNISEIYLNIY